MAIEFYGATFFTVVSYVSGYIAALLVATCVGALPPSSLAPAISF
jgi:hypothetical protein